MMRWPSASSVCTPVSARMPKFMVPRHSGLTRSPVRPSSRYSMVISPSVVSP